MLAPISNGRRDKGTSFKRLKDYLTKERDPETGEEMFRGEMILSDNLASLETAHLEMTGIAAHNPLCKDPVYHFQITWHPGERPIREQWQTAALRTLRDLGFSEHQYLIVAHNDKAHFHIHIMVNKVHPETYRAHTPYYDMFTLDKAMRELEYEQGWMEAVGNYRWDKERGIAVKNTREEMRALSVRERQARGKAAELEHYHDAESLQAYVKGKPAADLQMLLARHTVGWSDVHAMLHQYGLEMHQGEQGGYTVQSIGSGIRVKASDVFRRAFAGKLNRAETERKLGPWREASLEDRAGGDRSDQYEQHSTRDPEKRTQRREEREHARQELKHQFAVYRTDCRERQKAYTVDVRKRRTELSDQLKLAKKQIRAQELPWPVKWAQLSRTVAEHVVQQRLLRVEALRERLKLQGLTYQQWVMGKAEAGDKAAAAQLRGWRYHDQRNINKLDKVIASERDTLHLSAGGPFDESEWTELTNDRLRELQRNEQIARIIAATRWTINRRSGDVHYTVGGKLALVDRGKTISVLTTDEAAMVLGLEIAMKKYGSLINASGPEVWKEQVARAAARNAVFIQFTDARMQQIIFAEQMKLDRLGMMAKQLLDIQAQVANRPEASFQLADRDAAYVLMGGIFGLVRGRGLVNDLHGNLQLGEVRRTNIKNIFYFDITRTADGTVTYTVAPMTGKGAELTKLLHDAAGQMGKTSAMQRPAMGQVGHKREQDRERKKSHEKDFGLE
ncbi:MAG TPA: TraI/MobA(P) family conjugative relaxase [Acidobacteriaceae bacterium]